MPRRRAGWIWVARAVAVLLLAGLVAYLSTVGLDKANKLASVITGVMAVAALAAPYLFPPPGQSSSPAPAQSVKGTRIKGHLTQFRIGQPGRSQAPSGAQQVTDSEVGGNLTQIDGSGDQAPG